MKIYLGADHAGYEFKEKLKIYLSELGPGYEIIDKGAFEYDANDDYPDFIHAVAIAVANDPESRGIVLGASGQGEAMCANRVTGARAAVFYGPARAPQKDLSGHTLDMIASVRMHNDANILALGARFLGEEEAKEAVKIFLTTPFSGDERHLRRINKLG